MEKMIQREGKEGRKKKQRIHKEPAGLKNIKQQNENKTTKQKETHGKNILLTLPT